MKEQKPRPLHNQPRSLRTMLLGTIIVCWVLPIFIVVAVAGLLLSQSYERSVRQEIETTAQGALRQVEMRFETEFEDSKSVSYDGVVRSAYQDYQQDGDGADLYRTVNGYLSKFSRNTSLKAVFLCFWEETGAHPYTTGNGTTGYGLLRDFRRVAERRILEEMAEADTAIRVLQYDGELYIARNLMDSAFTPYATFVMLCDKETMFQSLSTLRRLGAVTLLMDESVLLTEEGTLNAPDGATAEDALVFTAGSAEHPLRLSVTPGSFDIWSDMPGLATAIGAVALLVLPLLLAMIFLFRRLVTDPVDTLVAANERLEEGERGYEIEGRAGSKEFQKLYGHFNSMSVEMRNQFERSYLEQQALQQAQVKALQSQINPHFLNNTLEIINWEARMAGDDRVSAMIEALSTMLDAALDRDGRGQVHLREELSYVDAYLYIIKERLGDRLEVEREIDEALLDEQVPRLILQPIVENAVEHDIAARKGGRLVVRALREGENMVLEVEHDGALTRADEEALRALAAAPVGESPSGGHVGLRNVHQRLGLLYGERGILTVTEPVPGTVLARVSFPAGT